MSRTLGRAKWLMAISAASLVAASMPVFAQQTSNAISQSGLVGKLEGASIVTDPAAIPKAFQEAPQLAELVKAGKLPAVKDRLPSEPLVLKPVHSVGKYGGTWRRGFTGPGDVENGNRINASDKLMFWDPTGTKIVPSVAKGVDMSADGKTFTISLRKGMKLSLIHI